jgi:hypothetical protein
MEMTFTYADEQHTKWLKALEALQSGLSYSIATESGQRQLTRNNIPEVMKMVSYWNRERNRLKNGKRSNHSFSVAKFS